MIERGFTEEYYESVMHTYAYRHFVMDHFDFELSGMKPEELELRFLCHNGAREFARISKDCRVVTTGFGMSGIPHAGTLSQIAKIIKFQQSGEQCQVVLGDLDAYNGKQVSLTEACDLARRYSEFIISCGFDQNTGIIRSQYDNVSCLRTMYLLANYAREQDFVEAEEDLHDHYSSLGLVDTKMTFRRQCSLSLMAADFIDLAQDKSVLVMLGIDEHKYVNFARNVAARFDNNTSLRKANISSIYTRMISGFDGHPKMSKSIPGSGLDVCSSPDEIAALVRTDDVSDPNRSPTFQLAYQLFVGSLEETMRWREACIRQDQQWNAVKERVIDTVIEMARLW